jgi:hypothetical protein
MRVIVTSLLSWGVAVSPAFALSPRLLLHPLIVHVDITLGHNSGRRRLTQTQFTTRVTPKSS